MKEEKKNDEKAELAIEFYNLTVQSEQLRIAIDNTVSRQREISKRIEEIKAAEVKDAKSA